MSNYTREFPFANVSHIYAYELFEALRREILYDTDFALDEDEGFYAKIERDPEIARLIRYRAQLVSGSADEWACEPASESEVDREAASVMNAILRKIRKFQSARYNLSMAFLKGTTWGYLKWGRQFVNIPNYGRMLFACVGEIRDIDKRRFDRVHEYVYDAKGPRSIWRWKIATGLDRGGPIWEPIDPRKYIHHVYHDEERALGHGKGISAPIYFLQWWKSEAMRNGMQFINRWSQGLIVYVIDKLARGGVGSTSDQRGKDALALIDKIRAGNNIVVPDKEAVQVHDAPQGGWSTAKEALDYCDEQLSKLILGSVLPTGGGTDKGSLARAEVEDTAMARLIGYDRNILGETFTDDLIEPLWRINWPVLRMMGLGKAEMPRFVLRREETLDGEQLANRLKTVLDAVPSLDKRIGVRQIMEQLGLTEAGDNEETLASLADGEADELNMADVLKVVESVSAGSIPPATAMVLLGMYPGITDAKARALVIPAAKQPKPVPLEGVA